MRIIDVRIRVAGAELEKSLVNSHKQYKKNIGIRQLLYAWDYEWVLHHES